ncbi:YeiH family protein [Leptospira ilyithenensis]|uniref:YeiH family protein n=1 Tax=Leptospira ilyithenensis TaxID=2484901 RepID=A0A4R9LY08_9LEPT|nr:YeiH family protein [Leptospira ilyithenensis]TGN14651.1 YeiH family protein [Leptospira ilyithenensis]
MENFKITYLLGILVPILLGIFGIVLGDFPKMKALGLSALTISLLFGFILGNVSSSFFSNTFGNGVQLIAKRFLRWGVILYGLQLTLGDVLEIGGIGFLSDIFILLTTLPLGIWFGTKILKMDRDTAILTSAGSSICGAAAVLATEGTLKSESYKSSTAVATVVTFGTISMFLLPALYPLLGGGPNQFGILVGSTVHEVAQVVAAGASVSEKVSQTAVIVKLTKVMLLVPFLIGLGYWKKTQSEKGSSGSSQVTVPWFAVGFVIMIAINSLGILGDFAKQGLLRVDLLFLSSAMAALGWETKLVKIFQTGSKAFILALVLFLWLLFGGIGFEYLVLFR